MDVSLFISLCKECSETVYNTTAPSPRYAEAAAFLLMGTGATESKLTFRRQGGYDFSSDGGAWGIMQTEKLSVEDNISMLKSRPLLRQRSAMFIYGNAGDPQMKGLLELDVSSMLRLIHSWDRLAILMARLHYFHRSQPIPFTITQQAAYYKVHYNSIKGKGSVYKYIEDWKNIIEGHLNDQ